MERNVASKTAPAWRTGKKTQQVGCKRPNTIYPMCFGTSHLSQATRFFRQCTYPLWSTCDLHSYPTQPSWSWLPWPRPLVTSRLLLGEVNDIETKRRLSLLLAQSEYKVRTKNIPQGNIQVEQYVKRVFFTQLPLALTTPVWIFSCLE